MFQTMTTDPDEAAAGPEHASTEHRVAATGRPLAALTSARAGMTFLWAAVSCVLLLVGGLGPQAHSAALNLGELGEGTITQAYVVSGTIYVLAALLAGAGLTAYAMSANPRPWTWKLGLCVAMIGAVGAGFSLLQISGTSQVAPVSAGWGVHVALAASISLVASLAVLAHRAKREAA